MPIFLNVLHGLLGSSLGDAGGAGAPLLFPQELLGDTASLMHRLVVSRLEVAPTLTVARNRNRRRFAALADLLQVVSMRQRRDRITFSERGHFHGRLITLARETRRIDGVKLAATSRRVGFEGGAILCVRRLVNVLGVLSQQLLLVVLAIDIHL